MSNHIFLPVMRTSKRPGGALKFAFISTIILSGGNFPHLGKKASSAAELKVAGTLILIPTHIPQVFHGVNKKCLEIFCAEAFLKTCFYEWHNGSS